MMFDTTTILDLLAAVPGRYIQHESDSYCMKDPDGADVVVKKDHHDYLVEPSTEQMNDLVYASYLVHEGSRYRLRG